MSVAPVTEIGKVQQRGFTFSDGFRLVPWSSFVDEDEYVPALTWPVSNVTYDRMRTDSQLAALDAALTMQARRMKWMIDPNGSHPDIVQKMSIDYNLPIQGEEQHHQRRQKKRFSFGNHQRLAFLAGVYGHMFFEQVGYIGPDGLWHLRKLAPRMPRHISDILTADDGGLVSIKQQFTRQGNRIFAGLGSQVEIPVDRLVAYVMNQETNWVGRSWYRNCYRNWLVKDRLIRVDAINHERAGGVPWVEAPAGATPAEMESLAKMAQGFKVGEDAGGSVPKGGALNIAKVGSGTDVIGSIRYHDEAMARERLLMWMELGMTQTGSRALGDSFEKIAHYATLTLCNWFRDTFNEHVIEDDVDWNWQNIDQVPLLTYVVSDEDEYLAVADLVAMVDKGLIQIDQELEDYLRDRFRLPELNPEKIRIPATPEGQAAASAYIENLVDRIIDIGATYDIKKRAYVQ